MKSNWCNTCRGPGDNSKDLIGCQSCSKKFHVECCGSKIEPDTNLKVWKCLFCLQDLEDQKEYDKENKGPKPRKVKSVAVRAKAVSAEINKYHRVLRNSTCKFFHRERVAFSRFISEERLSTLSTATVTGSSTQKSGGAQQGENAEGSSIIMDMSQKLAIVGDEPYINACLRSYQVEGINWMLSQYHSGVGGIMADEMGLGKTIQTLGFLAKLKESGLNGPHLIVTPLAVLQNWCNEARKFVPHMTVVKVQGSQVERDRILTDEKVLSGSFDIYLTTYETISSEEAFFTETFKFHTIVIDEGQRLKNDSCKLCKSLERIFTPFRMILTGTPLQNNLGELWALMKFILPNHLGKCEEITDPLDSSALDYDLVQSCRLLLEALMIRRVKSEVEKLLLPKMQYILKVPLSDLQREWYQIIQSRQIGKSSALLTTTQLYATFMQLQKVMNHPKCILYSHDRAMLELERKRHAAEGSEFVDLSFGKTTMSIKRSGGDGGDGGGNEQAADQALFADLKHASSLAIVGSEAELRSLEGVSLIQASGKLQLLDRLLHRLFAEKSRVLLFSQYTLALDVLSEYITFKYGGEGVGYLRLDGSTNRIKKDMDVRAFNAPGSPIPIYLISTKAGGVGINLASADVVVLYDTCYNPQVDLQAQDRAHRIGQTKQVKVYRLIAESTLEEKILSRSRQKLVLDELVIKKQGEVSALSHKYMTQEEQSIQTRKNNEGASSSSGGGDAASNSDDGGLEKLSVQELWKFLHIGYKKEFKPKSTSERRVLSDQELDDIIDNGQLLQHEETEEEVLEVLSENEEDDDESNADNDHAGFIDEDGNKIDMNKLTGRDKQGKGLYAYIEVTSDGEDQNPLVAGKRNRKPPKNYSPPRQLKRQQTKRVRLLHESYCFTCNDGGDLIECSVCPKVYHVSEACSFIKGGKVPRGAWRCIWHNCFICDRSSSNCGGMLFHCISCPITYCFDCCPENAIDQQSNHLVAIASTKKRLEQHGCPSLNAKTFFKCEDCSQVASQQNDKSSLLSPSSRVQPSSLPSLSSTSSQDIKAEITMEDDNDKDHSEESDDGMEEEEEEEEEEEVDEDDAQDYNKSSKRPGKCYACNRCGLPKKGHTCAFN